MNWDLTSYFPAFGGAEMRAFKQTLTGDLAALQARAGALDTLATGNADANGQVVDVSLFEPLFRLCIPHVTMFDMLGINRERVGNDFPAAAPRTRSPISARWSASAAICLAKQITLCGG